MPSDAWLLLTQGDVLNAALQVFITPMGYWFFILMFATIEIVLYIKTEGTTMPIIIALFTSAVMMFIAPEGSTAIPEMLTIARSLFVIAVAGLVYKIWKGR